MRVYVDTEFTGLHQHTTLISIGCVTQDISREAFADIDRTAPIPKHHALWDAIIIQHCVKKLLTKGDPHG